MNYNPLRGFKYPTPMEAKIGNFIRNVYYELAQSYNINFLNPPLLAKTKIFQSLGIGSDVVRKELYSFTQKDGEEVCLIPEYTRIFVEQMAHDQTFMGSYGCFGACFRYERPQLGRYRSFTQMSIETIGSSHYMKDIELFCFLRDFFHRISLTNYKIFINSIGTMEDRRIYEGVLENYFQEHLSKMSSNGKAKFERKAFLRMLDSKDPEDLVYILKAPPITQFLCEESQKKYQQIKNTLRSLNIVFEENPLLVRGLDYYNDLVFEYTHEDMGAQSSILGGGRYDGLFKEVTGKSVPAVGFAIGIERVIYLLEKNKTFMAHLNALMKIAIIPVEEGEYLYALEIFQILKTIGTLSILYHKNVSQRLKQCHKENYEYVLMIGETEKNARQVIIKNMFKNQEELVAVEDLALYFLKIKEEQPSTP